MEKQIGINSKRLGEIFAQIKATNQQQLGDEIYSAYLPYVEVYSNKFELSKEQVQDIYTDVFCFVYNNVLNGYITAGEFDKAFVKIMDKQCSKLKQETTFNSTMLGLAYAKNMPSHEQEDREIQEVKAQSYLFTVNLLNELIKNPELAEANGLTANKIEMLKDYYAINPENKAYTVKELALKYNVTESRVVAVIASSIQKLKHMQQVQVAKSQFKI